MHETIKYVWLCMAFFTICGLIAMLPFDKWSQAYMNTYHRLKSEPQRRIEATYKYIQDIEDGVISIDNGISFEEYYKKILLENSYKQAILPQKRYQKPLYVRDKINPKILHPYRGK